MMATKVNVLGTEYTITYATKAEDAKLAECSGYCDKSTKRIVVAQKPDDNELGDYEQYQRKILRHEIIHAFLFESGVDMCYESPYENGHDEFMVDWIAIQFTKLLAAFKEADAL